MLKIFSKSEVAHSGSKARLLPSIWNGRFDCYSSWQAAVNEVNEFTEIIDGIDDRLLYSRHSFGLKAWCSVCGCMRTMQFRWYYSHPTQGGSTQPAWSETPNCDGCLLNSRMRAVFSFMRSVGISSGSDLYITEAVTDGFRRFKDHYPSAVGSEYFGAKHHSGEFYSVDGMGEVMHQDLTCLSFSKNSFDVILSQEVFEHIPDYKKALAECYRVLRKNGRLIFTIPFNHGLAKTIIRARVLPGEGVIHDMPPIYHGNPVDEAGSLCFQDFGWDILDDLRSVGFSDVSANLYWGPWQGHLGNYFFVFCAKV